jgi:phosphatidylglycerol---prolipoprotein diacylglyceryl transferase
MFTYLLWWGAGGAVGIVGGLCLLRARDTLGAATIAAYLPAIAGFLYGAKLQFRIGHLPFWEAVAIPPAELLTPGYHVPLGLVLGFVFAAIACLVLRAPVLEMGDALAVTGAAMMPIGRIGCLLSGCCAGVVCGPWFRPLCLTFPPGTEAYLSQVETGLITSAAPASLPAHPLQLYFGAAALVVLWVEVWLLRKRAPAGSLLVTAFFLYPLAQFGLEFLRAPLAGRQTGVMTTVLLGTVLADLTVLAVVLAWRHRLPFRGTRLSTLKQVRAARTIPAVQTKGDPA